MATITYAQLNTLSNKVALRVFYRWIAEYHTVVGGTANERRENIDTFQFQSMA